MDYSQLADVLRKRAAELLKKAQDAEEFQAGHDAECLNVLARILEGKTIDKAFGAPGDWGYGTPIGDAL